MNYDYLKSPCHQKRISIVAKELRRHHCNKNNLSIGCGNGAIEKQFPGNFIGLDINKTKKPHIPVTIGKAEDLLNIFNENQFGAIFIGETLEHIYDTNKIISDMSHILKRNGILIITVPNLISLRARIRCLFGKTPRQATGYLENEHLYGHIRHFGKGSITSLLKKHKFKILKVSTPSLSYNPFSSNSKQEILNVPIFLSGLGNNLIITARNQK
jgi:O-antigen biosynthesis protein